MDIKNILIDKGLIIPIGILLFILWRYKNVDEDNQRLIRIGCLIPIIVIGGGVVAEYNEKYALGLILLIIAVFVFKLFKQPKLLKMKEIFDKIISYLSYDLLEGIKLLRFTLISIPILFFILRIGIVKDEYALAFLIFGIPTFITYATSCVDEKISLFERPFLDVLGDLFSAFGVTLFFAFLPWCFIYVLILFIIY